MGADFWPSYLYPILVHSGGRILGSGRMGPRVHRVGAVIPEGAYRWCVDSGVELCCRAGGDTAFGGRGIFLCGFRRKVYGTHAGG